MKKSSPKLTAALYSGYLPADSSAVAMETVRTYRGGGDVFYHRVSGWKVQISLVQAIICLF